MRIGRLMVINTDDTGWGIYATAFGFVAVSDLMGQFATTILTLAVSITVAHFLRRELQRRWPLEPKRRRRTKPLTPET